MKQMKRLFKKRKNRRNKSEKYKHIGLQDATNIISGTDSTSYSSNPSHEDGAASHEDDNYVPSEQHPQGVYDSSSFLTPLKSNLRRERGSLRSPKRNMQQQFLEIEEEEDYEEDGDENLDQYQEQEQPYTLQSLIHDIDTCQETFTEKPAKALRTLFTLSDDNPSNEENRIGMVREASGKLVPTLLNFLTRIEDELSSERYLTLLVLNNISIPAENKRIVALDCGGARILSRLLCKDPSCHLISIILANLTYSSDFELSNELIERTSGSGIDLVPALIYAFKISTLTSEEYSLFGSRIDPTSHNGSPRDYLDSLSSVEQSVVNESITPTHLKGEIGKLIDLDDYDGNENENEEGPASITDSLQTGFVEFNPQNIMYKETARWCMCTLRNLTRSPSNEAVLHAILESGVLPLLLKVLSVRDPFENDENRLDSYHQFRQGSGTLSKSSESQKPQNHVYHWENNSIQDMALYVLLELALNPSTRDIINQDRSDVIFILSRVAEYSSCAPNDLVEMKEKESQKDMQCLKARMALAFLIGSGEQLGQHSSDIIQDRSDSGDGNIQRDDLHLMMLKGSETALIVELLANVIHGRGKDGPGGYRPSIFSPKMVLYAIRCLVANKLNVRTFHVTRCVQINSLLLKAIALYSFTEDSMIDDEAAEDACFTLYIMSGLGFMGPFLSGITHVTLFSKILLYYFRKKSNITGAGSHATRQLLLRASSLNFDGSVDDSYEEDMDENHNDYDLDENIVIMAERVQMDHDLECGVEPLDDIFGRPIIRKSGKSEVVFRSALDAVPELLFGRDSQMLDSIDQADDILIANTIAACANGEEKTTMYGYKWIWEDAHDVIKDDNIRSRLEDFKSGRLTSVKNILHNLREEKGKEKRHHHQSMPLSFFGWNCGSACQPSS